MEKPPRWAVLYATLPYVGRNSEKKSSLADIEYERRTGYGYAGTWPAGLLATDYPAWQRRVGKMAK